MANIGNLFVKLGLNKGSFDAGIASARKSVKRFADSTTKQLTRLVGGWTSVIAVIKGLSSAVKTMASFERANSTLASVLGKTKAEVQALTESAKQLGRMTEFTASNVTELQTALARLGFNDKQIMAMQGSVLKFASAVGTDLASAADFTGSAIRAFGLRASDTSTLLDVMAKSTSASALDFSKLATSISIVAPIAQSFGLTTSETAAFLGVLANNGFDASSAATALRNILLNLADSSGKLSKGIGHSAKSFDEILEAFGELQARGIKVDEVLAMTDKRSAAAATTIISSAEAVRELNTQLANSKGSLDEMYTTMTDNLVGATNNLKSAWEGLMLSFGNSTGPIKKAVDWLTKLVNTMTDFNTSVQTGGASTKDKKVLEWYKSQFEGMAQDKGADYMRQQYELTLQRDEAAYEAALDVYLKKRTRANKKALEYAGRNVMALNDLSSWLRDYGTAPDEPMAPLPTTTAPGGPGADLSDTERKQAEQLAERAKVAAMAEIDALKYKYDEELKLLQKYGLDSTSLTYNYQMDLIKIMGDSMDEVQTEIDSLEPVEDFVPLKLDDDALDNLKDKLKEWRKELELTAEVQRTITDGIVDSLAGAASEIGTQLANLSNFDGAAVMQSALEPLADIAVKAGEIIMAEGVATIAAKRTLETFGATGAGAIAAGAALIAAGSAAKAGLAALSSGTATAAGVTTYSGASSTANQDTVVTSSKLEVVVTGKISGSDILLAGKRASDKQNR